MFCNSIRVFLLTVAITVAAVNTFAQTYSLTPGDSISQNGILEHLSSLSIQQQNNTSDTLILKWQKVSENVPALWEATVCDNSFCNTSLVDSGTMNPVFPGDYGLLLLHITPHVNYGTAIVRYSVWNAATPNLIDTLTFILKVNQVSGISDYTNPNTAEAFIYPNPAHDFININIKTNSNETFWVELFNESGSKVYSLPYKTGISSLKIESLPSGTYLITLHSQSQNFTKVFVKH